MFFESSQCLGEEEGKERGKGAVSSAETFLMVSVTFCGENHSREKQERIFKLTGKDLLKGTLLSVKLSMGPEKAPWARSLSHGFAYEMQFVSEAAEYFYLGVIPVNCPLITDLWEASEGRRATTKTQVQLLKFMGFSTFPLPTQKLSALSEHCHI